LFILFFKHLFDPLNIFPLFSFSLEFILFSFIISSFSIFLKLLQHIKRMLFIIFTLSIVFCNIHFFYHFSIVICFWFRLRSNCCLLPFFTVWIKCFSNLFEVHFCNVSSLNITIDWPLLQNNLFIHYSSFHFINFFFLSFIHFIFFVLGFGDLFSFLVSFFFLFFFGFVFFWNFNAKGSKLICSFVVNLIVFFVRGKFDPCLVIDWHYGSIDLHCILCSDTFFWQTCENINHSMEIVVLLEINVCI
jgi:hypothetical protein